MWADFDWILVFLFFSPYSYAINIKDNIIYGKRYLIVFFPQYFNINLNE